MYSRRSENDSTHDIHRNTHRSMTKWIVGGMVGAAFATAGIFFTKRYRIAGPTEYIVRTGFNIPDVDIRKQALQWPFQTFRRLDMTPATYTVKVEAMSKQRIPFIMPSVWTIGPDVDLLKAYAKLLIDKDPKELQKTVEGIIQGEARILAANMDLDALFSDRASFKKNVTQQINDVLKDLGLKVYNSNVAELDDHDSETKYFTQQRRRALQEVDTEARVHVSKAVRDGETGEKKNQTEARQQVAKFETEAKLIENERLREIAESNKNRVVAEAGYEKERAIAQAESEAAAQQRIWELQQKVETARSQQEIEKLRASELSAASVKAEVQIRETEGKAASVRLEAEAQLYAKQKEAEAQLFAKQKEAEGILAVKNAEAKGLQELLKSAGNSDALVRYLLVSNENQLRDLAHEQGEALRGLQPKVNIWSTGPQTDDASRLLTNLFKTSVPLLSGIKEQTGIDFLQSFNAKPENVDHAKPADKKTQDSSDSSVELLKRRF